MGDPGLTPGLGRSPEEENGYPLQYSGPENSWTEEPGGLQSMAPQKADTTEQLAISLFPMFKKEITL